MTKRETKQPISDCKSSAVTSVQEVLNKNEDWAAIEQAVVANLIWGWGLTRSAAGVGLLLASLSDGSGAAKHAGDLAAAVIDSRSCEWGVRGGREWGYGGMLHMMSAKTLDFFYPFPLVRIGQLIYTIKVTQPHFLCLLFGDPPPPSADMICTCPLGWMRLTRERRIASQRFIDNWCRFPSLDVISFAENNQSRMPIEKPAAAARSSIFNEDELSRDAANWTGCFFVSEYYYSSKFNYFLLYLP